MIEGAGSGIGRAACKILVREGVKVIAADRNFEAAKETQKLLGDNVYAIEVDVSSSKSVKTCLSEALKVFKIPPSILVNAAGISRDNFIFNMSEEEFDDVIRVNLKVRSQWYATIISSNDSFLHFHLQGTFLMMQQFAMAMVEHDVKSGSIVNISSIIGKIGSHGLANYSASKAGVDAMTKTASKEFGKYGIRVNAILPGFITTPMTDPVPDKVKDLFIKSINLRRFGEASEVGEVIAFLASEKSSFVNGASIECTGGM